MFRRPLAVFIALAASAASAAPARPSLTVELDHAKVVKVARAASTVIIGNPAIADVTVRDANTIVLTGRSYGSTNLIVLDAAGNAILDETVGVKGYETATVRIYRQTERQTLACLPTCEPTVTVGDNDFNYSLTVDQFSKRETLAAPAASPSK